MEKEGKHDPADLHAQYELQIQFSNVEVLLPMPLLPISKVKTSPVLPTCLVSRHPMLPTTWIPSLVYPTLPILPSSTLPVLPTHPSSTLPVLPIQRFSIFHSLLCWSGRHTQRAWGL
jgi:hypothetical protein